ncbi:MAG: glycoside hydrolase family 97 catalytic domain-containing protein [Thermoplasmatota archaeon]
MPWVEETSCRQAPAGKLLAFAILITLMLSSAGILSEQTSRGLETGAASAAPAGNDEGATRGASNISLVSPGGRTTIRFWYGGSSISYDMWFGNEQVLKASRLGLLLENGDAIPSGPVVLQGAVMDTCRGEYRVDFAERSVYKEEFRSAEITLKEATGAGRTFRLSFRAYNEGVALRYSVPDQKGIGKTVIVGESTSFSFTKDLLCFAEYGTEDEYQRVPLSKVRAECEVPLTIELQNGRYASIGEAALLDHSRMLLKNSGNQSTSLQVQLCAMVVKPGGFETPWRVVLVGSGPGDLLENSHILYSLCPQNSIGDTSWIAPGKAFRDCSLTTNGSKAVIDFCGKNGLQYVHLDAGWYGKEHDSRSDATTVSAPDLDIQEVVRYGKERGIGVVLYVNNRSLRKQLDEILPLYQQWGIKGIKFGFVDGRSQGGINFLHSAVKKAADHGLFVIIHDNYRPTGLTRTYPNILSVEGVRGNEHFPTSSHNSLLPYTRSVCGPMDYTPMAAPYKDRTTYCHQMALPFVYFSPVTCMYWYQDPVKMGNTGAFEAWSRLPTVWDEAIYPDDMPGRYASAMKKKGDVWYIGAVNGPLATKAVVDLAPLRAGSVFSATVYSDLNGIIDIRRYLVDARTVIDEDLLPNGGSCIIVRPATNNDLENLGWYPSWSRTSTEVTIEEDREMVLLLHASGSGIQNISYDTWVDSDFISFDPVTCVVSGTPLNEHVGTHHLSILVRYEGEPVSSLHVTLNVLNTNDPPEVIRIPRYLELGPGEDLIVEPEAVDIDPTGDELEWSFLGEAGFLEIDPLTGRIRGTPGEEDVGVRLVEVCVEDGNGGRCVRQIVVYVNASSDELRIRTLDSVVFLCEDVPFELDLLKELRERCDGPIQLVFERVPHFAAVDPGSGMLCGTPRQDDVGTHEVVIRSKPLNGSEELLQFRMVVAESNDPPAFLNGSIFIMTVAGERLDIRFPVEDEDDEREELIWSLSPEGTFLKLDSTTGSLRGTVASGDEGIHRFVLTVRDPRNESASIDLTILVVDSGSFGDLFKESAIPPDRPVVNGSVSMWDDTGTIILWNGSARVLAVPMNDEVRKYLEDREERENHKVESTDDDGQNAILPLLLIVMSLVILLIPVINHTKRRSRKKNG